MTRDQLEHLLRASANVLNDLAQGVGPNKAVLPKGWEDRVVRIDTAASSPGIGLCLDVHDLALSKYVAGRNKDIEFTAELAHQGLTNRVTLLERLAFTEITPTLRKMVTQRIASHFRIRS